MTTLNARANQAYHAGPAEQCREVRPDGQYSEGLAHGWEDCRKAVREILERRDISDRRKLELITRLAHREVSACDVPGTL